jgi:hypothetical protein
MSNTLTSSILSMYLVKVSRDRNVRQKQLQTNRFRQKHDCIGKAKHDLYDSKIFEAPTRLHLTATALV